MSKRFTWTDGEFEVVESGDRTDDFHPDEPRAADGKWGEGGASGTAKAPAQKGETKDPKDKPEAKAHEGASFEDWHKANPNGNGEVFSAAQEYLRTAKLPPLQALSQQNLSQEEGRSIASSYDAAKSDPDNKETQAAYRAFNAELAAQRKVAEGAGYKFEAWTKPGQPYANSKEMMKDVRDNKHLYYFKSTEGTTPNKLMSLDENDTFRAVHDLFGHAMAGNQFGPKGETNAFLDHVQMFSPDARKALATETVGQNAWFNFSKANEGKPVSQRSFADQKAFLLDPKLYQPLIDRAMKHDADDTEDTDLYFTCPCHRREAAARGDAFDPGEARDENGKWAGGTGSATPGKVASVGKGRGWQPPAHWNGRDAKRTALGEQSRQAKAASANATTAADHTHAASLHQAAAAAHQEHGQKLAAEAKHEKSVGMTAANRYSHAEAKTTLKTADEHRAAARKETKLAAESPAPHGGATELAEKANAGGGFTYDPHHGKYPTEGYAVSMHPGHEEVIRSKELSPEVVKGYLDRHGDYIQKHPGAHVGGWYDPEAGKWYLDVSHVTNDPHEAESLAKQHNQEAYYDLGKHETVYVKSGKERRIDEREAQDTATRRQKDLLRPRQDVPRGDRGGDEAARGGGARPAGNPAPEARVDYSPDEPRAADGKWGDGGGRAAASTHVEHAKTSSVRSREHAAKAETEADRAKASKGKEQAKHVEAAHDHAREAERHAREASAAAERAKESGGEDSPSAKEADRHAAEAGAQAKAARAQASSAQKSASSGAQAGPARGAADKATKVAETLHAAAAEHPTKAGAVAEVADQHAKAARDHARAAAGAKTPEDAEKHVAKAAEHAAKSEEAVAKLKAEAAKHVAAHIKHEPDEHHGGHAEHGHAEHGKHEHEHNHKHVAESWQALLKMLMGAG